MLYGVISAFLLFAVGVVWIVRGYWRYYQFCQSLKRLEQNDQK